MTQHSGTGSTSKTGKKPKRGSGYPKRAPFFFHRYTKWLSKTCAAQDIGADGCWLLTIIVATEDSKWYRSAVSFYNAQLAMLCGWSVDKLARVRDKVIEHEFLHYEPGGNRTAGLYWVLVDGTLGDAPDLGPLGEQESDFKPQVAEHPADDSATEPRQSCGETPERPAELSSYPSLPKIPPPPPDATTVPTSQARIGNDASRVEVVEILRQAGLAAATQTADDAIAAGYTNGVIRSLVTELSRRPDLGPGALAWRLSQAPPDTPPTEGWPAAPPKPTPAPVVDIGRYTVTWSSMRPSRRTELARQAGIDLSVHADTIVAQGLRELPTDLRTQIVAMLAHAAGDKPPPSRT